MLDQTRHILFLRHDPLGIGDAAFKEFQGRAIQAIFQNSFIGPLLGLYLPLQRANQLTLLGDLGE